MAFRTFLLALLLTMLAIGCKKEETVMAPMGDAAPDYGSTLQLATLQGFLPGRWCLEMGGDTDATRYYEFKQDGTFDCGDSDSEWTAAGRWTVAGDRAHLTYETMKGKPFQQFQEEYRKDKQGGGQVAVARALFYDNLYQELGSMTSLAVDEDKKGLTFGNPQQAAPQLQDEGSAANALQDLLKDLLPRLQRMGPKKEQ
jgi:hypothetical protein